MGASLTTTTKTSFKVLTNTYLPRGLGFSLCTVQKLLLLREGYQPLLCLGDALLLPTQLLDLRQTKTRKAQALVSKNVRRTGDGYLNGEPGKITDAAV